MKAVDLDTEYELLKRAASALARQPHGPHRLLGDGQTELCESCHAVYPCPGKRWLDDYNEYRYRTGLDVWPASPTPVSYPDNHPINVEPWDWERTT